MKRNMFTESQTLEAILKSLTSYGNKVVEKTENKEGISVHVKCDREVYMRVKGGYFVQCGNHFYDRISSVFPECTNYKCTDIISSKSLGEDRICLSEEIANEITLSAMGQIFLSDTKNGVHSYFYATATDSSQTLSPEDEKCGIAPYVAAAFVCDNNRWQEKVEKLLGTVLNALWDSVCDPEGLEGENGLILECGYDTDSTWMETFYIKVLRRNYVGKKSEYTSQLADISVTHISGDSFVVDCAVDVMNCYDLDCYKNEDVSAIYRKLVCIIYSICGSDRNRYCRIKTCQELDSIMLERAKTVAKGLPDTFSDDERLFNCKSGLSFTYSIIRKAIIEILNSIPTAIYSSMSLSTEVFADSVSDFDREESVIASISRYAEHFYSPEYYAKRALGLET